MTYFQKYQADLNRANTAAEREHYTFLFLSGRYEDDPVSVTTASVREPASVIDEMMEILENRVR
jgi:hypothetical protein